MPVLKNKSFEDMKTNPTGRSQWLNFFLKKSPYLKRKTTGVAGGLDL
jgi:hypothetical protein